MILEDGLWSKPERQQKLADANQLDARTHLYFFDLSLDVLRTRIERRNAALPPGAVPVSIEDLTRWHQCLNDPARASSRSSTKSQSISSRTSLGRPK